MPATFRANGKQILKGKDSIMYRATSDQIYDGIFDPVTMTRFWCSFVIGKNEDDCWNWIGPIGRGGYGRFNIERRAYAAHRVSYCVHHGTKKYLEGAKRLAAKTEIILHSCDNPSCINPAHMRIGTPRENTQDMIRRGRHRLGDCRGEDKPNAKLTEALVHQIRCDPRGATAIARELALSPSTVRHVKARRTWFHVL